MSRNEDEYTVDEIIKFADGAHPINAANILLEHLRWAIEAVEVNDIEKIDYGAVFGIAETVAHKIKMREKHIICGECRRSEGE